MKTAHLILTHKNYDLIDTGWKKIEYRRASDYWWKRLRHATHVTFHRGYTNTTMTFQIHHKVISDSIELHLGERIS